MRNMKHLFCAVLALCLSLPMLGGCAAQPASAAPAAAEQQPPLYSFVDDEGQTVAFSQPFERVISMYSAHTENLFSLDAASQVIGGYNTCTYPPEAAFLPMYDYNADPESVIAADPDLVLIRPFISDKAPDYVAALRGAGITVVSLYPDGFSQFPKYVRKLAMLVGKQPQAEQQLALLQTQLDGIAALTADMPDPPTVFFEATEVNLRTASADSMPARAIALAGGVNLAEGEPPLSAGGTIAGFGAERILQHADAIDVYVSQRGAMNAGGNEQSIRERPGFEAIKAVRQGRVHLINEKLISSPTFRYAQGVRELARFLYPETFDALDAYQTDDIATRAQLAAMVVRAAHLPVYLPSSSKYYQTAQKGHTFGLFADVHWRDDIFYDVETAVHRGCLPWERRADGSEWFYPDAPVTREELAHAVFLLGGFSVPDTPPAIADLQQCAQPRIVQSLVANGVLLLEDGSFSPTRTVTCREAAAALLLAVDSQNAESGISTKRQ